MDRFLVEQAQRGDREAFTTLAFELSDRLFAVAHRILRDFDSAGDALQVTLLSIWRDLPEPAGCGSDRVVGVPDPGARLPRSAAYEAAKGAGTPPLSASSG